MRFKKLLLFFIAVVALSLSACTVDRERPYGYLRLGPVKDLLRGETLIESDRLLVRHDERGFSVMSTLCTYDLSPLTRITDEAGKVVWASKFNTSRYALDGSVLQGPAEKPLHYYKLVLDSGVYGGPKDTLYVEIADRVDSAWRLAVTLNPS